MQAHRYVRTEAKFMRRLSTCCICSLPSYALIRKLKSLATLQAEDQSDFDKLYGSPKSHRQSDKLLARLNHLCDREIAGKLRCAEDDGGRAVINDLRQLRCDRAYRSGQGAGRDESCH